MDEKVDLLIHCFYNFMFSVAYYCFLSKPLWSKMVPREPIWADGLVFATSACVQYIMVKFDKPSFALAFGPKLTSFLQVACEIWTCINLYSELTKTHVVSSPSSPRAKSFPVSVLSSHQKRSTRSRQYLYFVAILKQICRADNQIQSIIYIKS